MTCWFMWEERRGFGEMVRIVKRNGIRIGICGSG